MLSAVSWMRFMCSVHAPMPSRDLYDASHNLTSLCHQDCVPCLLNCTNGYEHQGKCSGLCYQPCTIALCREPCNKTIDDCGHPCNGLCGQQCVAVGECQVRTEGKEDEADDLRRQPRVKSPVETSLRSMTSRITPISRYQARQMPPLVPASSVLFAFQLGLKQDLMLCISPCWFDCET